MIRRGAMLVFAAALLFYPVFALAQTSAAPCTTTAGAAGLAQIVPCDCNGNGGCQSICDLAQLAQNVLNDGIYVSVFLSAILFAWAGWKHMTAGGDTGQIHQANAVFKNVAIGLVIILSAWLVVDTIIGAIGGAPSGHLPWNEICQSS